MPFIKQVPSPSPPPPTTNDTSEHNKENIPPANFVNQFHLPNIVPKFDTHFKTYTQYRNYWNQCLGSWINDIDFMMFDRAYCHHRLILWQKDGLQNMQKLIDNQLAELNIQDQTQMNNIKLLLPSLQAKGLAICITDTLGWPDVMGKPPFSYPISAWPLPNQDYPVTQTPPPTTFIPELKKKQKHREECPKCRREYLYDHVAWARGHDSGYTCHCPKDPSPTQATSSWAPPTNQYPSLHYKPCRLCGTNPAHTHEFCHEYKFPHCHLYAPEHLPHNCKWWPRKPRHLTQVKEESRPPTPFNWDHEGVTTSLKLNGFRTVKFKSLLQSEHFKLIKLKCLRVSLEESSFLLKF